MPQLTLLGGALLEDEDGPVSGPASRRHPLALMALLATAPSRTRSRSKVVGFLWPETAEDRARNRLNTCVYRVRSGLGEEAVASVGDDLRLGDTVDCDVLRFREALEEGEPARAVDVYGGPFLDGFRVKGSPAFEKWVDRQRERLARAYRDALETLAANAGSEGDADAAARWWRKRAREDPYDSRVVGRLMEALAGSGNRADALRVARVHERLLEEELDAAPPPEIRELAERLREGGADVGPGLAARAGAGGDGTGRKGDAADDGRGPATAEGAPASAPAGGDGAGDGEDGDTDDRNAAPWNAGAVSGGDASLARLRPGRVVVLLLSVGAAAAIAWFLGVRSDRSAAADAGAPTVAVLPFDARGEGEAGVFAEGMHGDLLTRLAHVSGLEVIAATSAERFRDRDVPLSAIADSLGATWIVEGDVQQAGGRIQVYAQLVDPSAGTHAWAESYRRDLSARSLFDLQGDIARRIVRSLEARLSLEEAERVERRPTGSLGAYRSYVQGRTRLEERTAEGTRRAAEYFARAVRRDSGFALAWAGLADVAMLRAEYGYGHLPDSLQVAPERAVRRALALDSTLAEAHASLGYIHLNRAEGPDAVRELRRAVELKPSYPAAHLWLAETLAMAGRLDRAIPHVERAVELDPLAPVPRIPLGAFYYFDRRLEEALGQIRRGKDLAPDLALAHFVEAQILSGLGRHGEALEAFKRGRKLAAPGSVFAKVVRAWPAAIHARAGDTARARELLESSGRSPSDFFDRAVVLAALGDRDAALGALREAILTDHYVRTFYFRYAPVFDRLRGTDAYRELLREVNRRVGLEPDGSFPGDAAGG